MNRFMLAAVCIGASLLCGCSVKSSFNAEMMESQVQRIAVMPFKGPQEPEYIADMVRRTVHNNLSVLGFADMKLGEVDYRLEQAGVTPDEIRPGNAIELGEAVDADAFLFGTIRKTSNITAIAYSETQVKAEFHLVNAHTGKTMWQASHADGQRGGLLIEALHLMETFESQSANMVKQEAYQRAADKLARKVIDTLPDPAAERIATAPLPEVISAQTSARARGLQAGEQVVVVVKGPPGVTATMNIVGVRDYIPMREAPEGVYTGAYTIRKRMDGATGRIVCRLQDRSGNVSQRTIPVGGALASK